MNMLNILTQILQSLVSREISNSITSFYIQLVFNFFQSSLYFKFYFCP